MLVKRKRPYDLCKPLPGRADARVRKLSEDRKSPGWIVSVRARKGAGRSAGHPCRRRWYQGRDRARRRLADVTTGPTSGRTTGAVSYLAVPRLPGHIWHPPGTYSARGHRASAEGYRCGIGADEPL